MLSVHRFCWAAALSLAGQVALLSCGGSDDTTVGGGASSATTGGSNAGGSANVGGGGADTGGTGTGGAVPAVRSAIGTNFWNLGWGIWDDVFAAGVDFSTTDNPWNPAFLAEVSHYGVVRTMDFSQANISTEQTWAERTQPTDGPPGQERLAWEWIIDLSNRTSTDLWINLPTESDDDYALELATLIRAELEPDRVVYVEWSNETWNGGFPQAQYAIDRGLELGLDADGYTAGAKYHVYRAIRIFEQFDAVFGADDPHIVKVIAGQAVNTWLTGIHLAALQDATVNPSGMAVDAYAIAPYFGHDVDGNGADALPQLQAAVEAAVDAVNSQADAVGPAGLSLMAYEGGQHVTTGADVVSSTPEMYDLYSAYLDGVMPRLDRFVHYLHNGEWSSGGAWGAERYVGQPLSEAHKLRALYDWIEAHP